MIFEYCRNLGTLVKFGSPQSRNAGTWWMFKTEARKGGGWGEGNFEAGPDRRMSISDRPLRVAAAVSRLWSVARVLNSLSSCRSFKSAWNSRAGRFIFGIDVPSMINSCRGSRKASLILRIAKIVSNVVSYVIYRVFQKCWNIIEEYFSLQITSCWGKITRNIVFIYLFIHLFVI